MFILALSGCIVRGKLQYSLYNNIDCTQCAVVQWYSPGKAVIRHVALIFNFNIKPWKMLNTTGWCKTCLKINAMAYIFDNYNNKNV